jgi:NAD(P)-dependent dehydrogenase (short-subunit alcohol dehydrogenase family)
MGKVVFISGVSSGFGLATAKLLTNNGYNVYGTTRSGPGEISGVNYLHLDLTDNASIKNAVRQVIEKEQRIDILINNGGMHSGGPAEVLPDEYLKMQIETSFIGLVNLTREVLPLMRKQREGKIINISSIGGLIGLPYQAYYSAAKFAIEGFSEALRMEVKNYGIKVVLVNPGDFRTKNSANRRKFLASEQLCGPYSGQFSQTLNVIENDESNGMDPSILARSILKISESKNPKSRYIVATADQKLAVVLKKLLPGKIFDSIMMSHYKIS